MHPARHNQHLMPEPCPSLIWPHQHRFREAVTHEARWMLQLLGLPHQLDAFLFGIPDQAETAADASSEIAVEPGDGDYTPQIFGDPRTEMERLLAADERAQGCAEDGEPGLRILDKCRRAAASAAVLAQLRKLDAAGQYLFFCSIARHVGGHWMIIALRLRAESFAKLPVLHMDRPGTSPAPAKSFQHAVIERFLHACAEALLRPDAGAEPGIFDGEWPELLRAAGRRLCKVAATAAGNAEPDARLFDACNKVASMRYEGGESTGRIFLARDGHENVDLRLRFAEAIPFQNHRAVRKLLEITRGKDDLGLLSDSRVVWGLGALRGQYNPRAEDLFILRFTGHYAWELAHGADTLMQVAYGDPRLPQPKLDVTKLEMDLRRLFPDAGAEGAAAVRRVVEAAAEQRHGTMVVVSASAADEAARLAKQAFPVAPRLLDSREIEPLTRIDGALLLDPTGTCHAVGVILDGLVTAEGNNARGARYNSAVRYVVSQPARSSLAAVISEDGGVDIVPVLRPPLSRRQLDARLEAFRALVARDRIALVDYVALFNWFLEHRAYLSNAICEELNRLTARIDGGAEWWAVGPPFEQQGQFDEWYLEE